jgi:putative membrane protein
MSRTRGGTVGGFLAGLGAAYLKAQTESPLQRLFEDVTPPTGQEKELVGADPTGHPDRMPPAVLADRVVRRGGRTGLSSSQRVLASKLIHYTMGTILGAAYAGAAKRWPAVTRGAGAPAGLAIYLGTHASALPILRVQEPPWRLPASAVLWESTSHLVFGVTLETLRRALANP